MDEKTANRDEVLAFLAEQPGAPREVEPLSGGAWSSAWAYRAAGEDLVIRFGPERTWYEADRSATAFASTDLPVPVVREVGTAPSGRAYAISERHPGSFLEDTPVERADAVAPALTRLLVALYQAPPAPPGGPVVWHDPASTETSWRGHLLDCLVDDPARTVHGWGARLAADPQLSVLASAVETRVRTLTDACPERRDLVHGDLLHGNVLVSPDSRRIEAVLSWKCSVRGDFLFDAAWCTFWAPYHPGIAAADVLPRLLRDPALRRDPAALVDAAVRHHCYRDYSQCTGLRPGGEANPGAAPIWPRLCARICTVDRSPGQRGWFCCSMYCFTMLSGAPPTEPAKYEPDHRRWARQ